MPFKSERQRKFMWANHPEIARKWEEEAKKIEASKKNILKAAGITIRYLLSR